jgi:hypothetical protein
MSEKLLSQIQSLLRIQASGVAHPPIPGLAVQLLAGAASRIEALEAALREIAGQMLLSEHDEDYNGDYEAGYEAIVRIARSALGKEPCKCGVTCQDRGLEGGCRYARAALDKDAGK